MDAITAIFHFMQEKHMTAYALCKKSGISQSTLSNTINRNNVPSLLTLKKICTALDIKLSEFMRYLETEDENDREEIEEDIVSKELIKAYQTLGKEQRACVLQFVHLLQESNRQP